MLSVDNKITKYRKKLEGLVSSNKRQVYFDKLDFYKGLNADYSYEPSRPVQALFETQMGGYDQRGIDGLVAERNRIIAYINGLQAKKRIAVTDNSKLQKHVEDIENNFDKMVGVYIKMLGKFNEHLNLAREKLDNCVNSPAQSGEVQDTLKRIRQKAFHTTKEVDHAEKIMRGEEVKSDDIKEWIDENPQEGGTQEGGLKPDQAKTLKGYVTSLNATLDEIKKLTHANAPDGSKLEKVEKLHTTFEDLVVKILKEHGDFNILMQGLLKAIKDCYECVGKGDFNIDVGELEIPPHVPYTELKSKPCVEEPLQNQPSSSSSTPPARPPPPPPSQPSPSPSASQASVSQQLSSQQNFKERPSNDKYIRL